MQGGVGRRGGLGAEPGERLGEQVRPELGGAAAAIGQLGQAERGWVRERS